MRSIQFPHVFAVAVPSSLEPVRLLLRFGLTPRRECFVLCVERRLLRWIVAVAVKPGEIAGDTELLEPAPDVGRTPVIRPDELPEQQQQSKTH